jgi:predicted nucleic acid-binding Zn ribbon protein
MAIREYQCPRCSRIEERIEFRPQEPPVCGHENYPGFVVGIPMEQILSIPAQPQFKGSGFHSTDYPKR